MRCTVRRDLGFRITIKTSTIIKRFQDNILSCVAFRSNGATPAPHPDCVAALQPLKVGEGRLAQEPQVSPRHRHALDDVSYGGSHANRRASEHGDAGEHLLDVSYAEGRRQALLDRPAVAVEALDELEVERGPPDDGREEQDAADALDDLVGDGDRLMLLLARRPASKLYVVVWCVGRGIV